MIFTETDYERLATLFDGVCREGVDGCEPDAPCWEGPYAGYKPETREAPNGDGKVDAGKRYLHVSLKYSPPAWALEYLARAHFEACRVATALGVPPEFRPHEADATLRVLEYPAGAGSAEHTDFDLFTIVLWRSHEQDLELVRGAQDGTTLEARRISPGLHTGELGELVGLGPATPHRVPARPYKQASIVYFAMPDHGVRLPRRYHDFRNGLLPRLVDGQTVGEWLAKRIARSRI